MNKALIDSYLRNLLGVVLALVTTTMANAGVASPLDFGLGEWLTVANGLWAAAVPTLLRYVNKKDAAFGLVATAVASGVTKKLEEAAEAAKPAEEKAPAKAAAPVEEKPAPKPSAPKAATAKKPVAKKPPTKK